MTRHAPNQDEYERELIKSRRAKMLYARSKRKNPGGKGTPKKRFHYKITKAQFLAALEGTCGVKKRIAENLKCSQAQIYYMLDKKDWDDIREAYAEECERTLDKCEHALNDALDQRGKLMHNAIKAATWYLDRKGKHKGYGDKKELTLQGGDTPLQIGNTYTQINVETLPLDVRIQLLNQINTSDDSHDNDDEPPPSYIIKRKSK